MEPWLRTHGKLKRPELNRKQKMELRECFELFDIFGDGKCCFFCILGDMKTLFSWNSISRYKIRHYSRIPLSQMRNTRLSCAFEGDHCRLDSN